MLRRLTRYISSSSESSEDDISHPKQQVKMPVSSFQIRKFPKSQPNTYGSNSRPNKIKNSTNSFAPYLTRLRTQSTPPNSDNTDQSSNSETDDSLEPNPNRIRASSDYDTETRSDHTNDTNSPSLQSNSDKNNRVLVYSSDDSSAIQARSLKRRKTSVINSESSSESSDSGVPGQMRRASGKRTRLFSSSDSSSSTSSSSTDNSNENNAIDLETSFENEIISSISSRSPREPNRRARRPTASIPNRTPTQSQGRRSSSTQNRTFTSRESNTTRSTRQSHRSSEIGLRPNSIQLRNNRSSASTSATSQNPVRNTNRHNNRRLGEMLPNITAPSPSSRQIVSISIDNRPNLFNVTGQTTRRRQTNARSPNTYARQNRRTSRNQETVGRAHPRQSGTVRNQETIGRTPTNSTSATTRRRNITYTEPHGASDQETGFNLMISIRNGLQNVTVVHNPSSDFRVGSDTDSSSASSSDAMRPVLRRRRVIFSSDNTASSDSEASSVIVSRARRPIQIVISDNESEEETREKVVKTSENLHKVTLSDSDGETEKCPICFGRFEQQEVGTPKTCKHCFCLECIKKWAENNNTCPVDRRIFNSIIVRSNVHGDVVREEVVPPPNMAHQFSDDSFFGTFSDFSDSNSDSDLIFFGSDSELNYQIDYDVMDVDSRDYDGPNEICVVCTNSDGQDLLLCDLCDNVYHLQCLDPPLPDIPTYWVCPECEDPTNDD